jgi:outer membrane immunogenic protein
MDFTLSASLWLHDFTWIVARKQQTRAVGRSRLPRLVMWVCGRIMKKLALACVVFCGFAAPGIAADVSVLAPYQSPPLRPLYSWTGCRIGVNIGGGAAPQTFTDTTGEFGPIGANLGTHTARGVVGGGQIGCDYQAGPFVFGIQGLFDLSGMKADNVQPNGIFLDHTFVQTFATLTGRVGYTVQPSMLLYAKAGGAWVHDLYNVSTPTGLTVFALPPATIIALGSKTTGGWTVGGGFEWAFFGGDWSAFLEYDYMDFGTQRVIFLPALIPGPAFPIDIRQTVSMVLFGINYRFFGGAPRF